MVQWNLRTDERCNFIVVVMKFGFTVVEKIFLFFEQWSLQ